MRYSFFFVAVVILAASFEAGLAEDTSEKAARIENPKELLKLAKDLLPPNMMGGGFFRLSPSGNRYIYIRVYPGEKYGCKLHFGQFKPAATDSPALWDRAICFQCFLNSRMSLFFRTPSPLPLSPLPSPFPLALLAVLYPCLSVFIRGQKAVAVLCPSEPLCGNQNRPIQQNLGTFPNARASKDP